MDFFLIIIIFSLVVFFKSNKSYFTGLLGEKNVKRKLSKLDEEDYKVLNDLILPSDGSTKTTQIDHLVISKQGIFCIETKAYKGWIFGNARQEKWTRVFYKRKDRFYNPFRQNYAHIKSIEKIIGENYPNIKIFSLLVFTRATKLKISNTNDYELFTYLNNLTNLIKSKNKDKSLSDKDINYIYRLLSNSNINNKKERKDHIKEVRELKK